MSTTTISPQAKIGAIVGVLVLLIAGSAFYLMSGHSAPATIPTTPSVTPQPAPKPVHVVAPVVNPLIPAPLHAALERNQVVIAAFYNPNFPVGGLTVAEARAGAQNAHVGFVAIDLLDNSSAGPLTSLLSAGELLPNPGFLVYKRPGTVIYRSDGFLPRTAVAEAVKGAK